jgi:hypothetical protein
LIGEQKYLLLHIVLLLCIIKKQVFAVANPRAEEKETDALLEILSYAKRKESGISSMPGHLGIRRNDHEDRGS